MYIINGFQLNRFFFLTELFQGISSYKKWWILFSFCGLLYDAVGISEYIAWNGRMVREWRIGNNLEWSYHSVIYILSRHVWCTEKNLEKRHSSVCPGWGRLIWVKISLEAPVICVFIRLRFAFTRKHTSGQLPNADRASRSPGTLQFSHPRVDVDLLYLLRSASVPQSVGQGVIKTSQFYYTPNVCTRAVQSVHSGAFENLNQCRKVFHFCEKEVLHINSLKPSGYHMYHLL